MGCCSSEETKQHSQRQLKLEGQESPLPDSNEKVNTPPRIEIKDTVSDNTPAPKSPVEIEREKNERQMAFLEKAYREKRITKMKQDEAKIEKLNSDRSDRIKKQWTDRKSTEHFTLRELFNKIIQVHPYDPFTWEQYIRTFYKDDIDDEFGVESNNAGDDDDDIDATLWTPQNNISVKEVIDREGVFWALEQLLLPIPSKEDFLKDLDRSQIDETAINTIEKEIDRIRHVLWCFFAAPDQMDLEDHEIQTYLTYDDFSGGISGLISATVNWRSTEHKLISETLFSVIDHDHDGYIDSHDLSTLLLSLQKMNGAVFDYQSIVELTQEDISDKSMLLMGMDWGQNKENQELTHMNKRQFQHLFGALGEKHLKDLDIDNILDS